MQKCIKSEIYLYIFDPLRTPWNFRNKFLRETVKNEVFRKRTLPPSTRTPPEPRTPPNPLEPLGGPTVPIYASASSISFIYFSQHLPLTLSSFHLMTTSQSAPSKSTCLLDDASIIMILSGQHFFFHFLDFRYLFRVTFSASLIVWIIYSFEYIFCSIFSVLCIISADFLRVGPTLLY